MREKRYRICLAAPLGRRHGIMTVRETDGRVDGTLEVMGRETPFCGRLSDGGALTITGEMRSLLSTVPYTATGTLGDGKLLLNLKTASGACYPVSGEECSTDEEIL